MQAVGFSKDVNGDGIIDILDIAQVAKCYNVKSSDNRWNLKYDFNSDNIIDIYDMVVVSKVMGQTVSIYAAGNTSGNFANRSMAALSEGFIYYNKSSDGYKIYREKLDGTEQARVSDGSGSTINVVGDWVYYCVYFGDSGIYKVKKDGTSKTKLSSDKTMSIYIVGDWIYYDYSSGGISNIIRLKIDGTLREVIKLSNDNSLHNIDKEYIVEGDWIYANLFNSAMNKTQFFRVKTDGSARMLILDNAANHFSIVNGWVYYIPNRECHEISKIRPDGTEKTTIFRTNTEGFGLYSLNISDGYIYFSADIESANQEYRGIYKMKMDGTDVRKLTNTWCKHLCIAGEWIYFDGQTEVKRNTMKIKINGTSETDVY